MLFTGAAITDELSCLSLLGRVKLQTPLIYFRATEVSCWNMALGRALVRKGSSFPLLGLHFCSCGGTRGRELLCWKPTRGSLTSCAPHWAETGIEGEMHRAAEGHRGTEPVRQDKTLMKIKI